ncbi:MAG: hypothetical protein IT542_11130 [Rubellimicrobium sp.]|nr:hypothetical protein [Rubellimicrobium sp.]
MLRLILIGGAAIALSACQGRPPASNPGVGFGDYAQASMTAAPTTALGAPAAVTTGAIGAADLAAAGIGGGAPAGIAPAAPAPAPLAIQSSGISDEQDFSAVSGRESIESDAERLAQAAANYQVVQPTALPAQPQSTGPNIVEYALAAPNRIGQPWYSRFIFSGQRRFERNCASYRSPDEAQRDFLARGGPDRDPRGLDPDGDGFACGWDPAPVLAAVGRS